MGKRRQKAEKPDKEKEKENIRDDLLKGKGK